LDDLPSDIDLEMRISVVNNRLHYRMETRQPGAQAVHAIPRNGTVIVPEALRKQLMRRALTHAQVFVSPHSKLLRKELIEAIEHEGIACYNSGIDFFPRLDFKGIVKCSNGGKRFRRICSYKGLENN
jgi:hypothetical protein